VSIADRIAAKPQQVWVILGLIVALACFSPAQATPPGEELAPNTRVFIPIVVSANSVPQPEWLVYINQYRSAAGLPLLVEEPSWSQGDYLHSRYMVKNNLIAHSEEAGNPWYTPEGAAAAQKSNVMVSSDVNTPDNGAIDMWLAGPFHALGMLDPELQKVGYGSYRENLPGIKMGAAFDVLRGKGPIPASVTFPIRWPWSGAVISKYSFNGGESPNPLTGCKNYTLNTGLPVILQIGPGNLTPAVTAHSFQQGNVSLEHCIFDETNYSNPNSGDQSLGRSVLNSRDAVVLIPRSPLTPGKTYTVSITANGQAYTWSFTTAP